MGKEFVEREEGKGRKEWDGNGLLIQTTKDMENRNGMNE